MTDQLIIEDDDGAPELTVQTTSNSVLNVQTSSPQVLVVNDGPPGADGNTVLYGTAAPTTEGVDGNFYIRTTTNFIYGPKAGGVWPAGTSIVGPAGANGSNGTNGNTVLYGTAAPTTEGVNGDFYIRTTTNFIYGPKAAGAWPAGTSLIGPQGPAGNPVALTVEDVTGTTYTFVAGDSGKIKRFTSNSNINATCPNSLPQGWNCGIVQRGNGAVTFVQGSGAIITNCDGYTKTAGVGAPASLLVDTNVGGTAARYISGGRMA